MAIRHFFPILAVLAILILRPLTGLAGEILVIRSADLKPYDEAIAAFGKVVAALPSPPGVRVVEPYPITVLDLTRLDGAEDLSGQIRHLRPDLILAVGSKALEAVRDQPVPIVSVLVPDPSSIAPGSSRVAHVPIMASPEDQLAAIASALPRLKRLAILYDPGRSGKLVASFAAAARPLGAEIEAMPVANPKEVDRALAGLPKGVEAILLIPDPTVLTPVTLDLLAVSSLNRRIPLIGFAPKYLERGAVLAVTVEPAAMGEAAGHLAVSRLTGKPAPAGDLRRLKPEVQVNGRVAVQLGLDLRSPSTQGAPP